MIDNSYDPIAAAYRDSKQLSFRKCIEEYTLYQLVGDVSGLKMLDLACGEGIYTRKLKQRGAAEILGVDLSKEMIALAEEAEAQAPLDCKYLVHDVLTLHSSEEYDIVMGMYLLNYATCKEELHQFCKIAYQHLKSGGRFVGFNDNPLNLPVYYTTYKKYGFIKETPDNREEGAPIKYRMFNLDGTEFSFHNFYLAPETYAEAFAAAGFTDFRWEGPFLQSDEADNAHWTDFMAQPPMIGFSARK